MNQHRCILILRQRQGLLGTGFEGDGRRSGRLRLVADVVDHLALPVGPGRQQLVRRLFVGSCIEEAFAGLLAEVVDRRDALQRRGRAQLLDGVAAALLGSLCQVFGLVGAVDRLVRIGDDRHLQGNGIGQIVQNVGIERDADYENAVNQRCEKQHGRQEVGFLRRQEFDLVDRIGLHRDAGHVGMTVYLIW